MIPDYAYLTDPSNHDQRNEANADSNGPQADGKKDITIESVGADDSVTGNQDQEGQASTRNTIITPGKQLDQEFPVPSTSKVQAVRSRGKQLAQVLTSPENIQKRRCLDEKKKQIADKKENTAGRNTKKSLKGKEIIKGLKRKETKVKTRKKRKLSCSSSSEEEVAMVLQSDTESEDFGNSCVGCEEVWEQTRSNEDWIECITCKRWLHENCTSFPNHCLPCGRKNQHK